MKREEIVEIIADILEVECEAVVQDAVLEEFETWDSVAVLGVISEVGEKTGKYLHASEIVALKTIGDIMKLFQND